MSRIALRLIGILLAADVAAAQAPPGPAAVTAPQTDRAAIDRAIAAVFPSLVRVSVVYQDQQSGREIKGMSSGSGTIISPDGYVVTNHHVTGRPLRIVCTLATREEVPAELVGTDPLSDIAVLKLKPAKPQTFRAARFGDSSRLQRGQVVLAMGSPLALSQSVTQGIVSNTAMIMPQSLSSDANLLDGEDVGTIVRWIGHDAAIYPGNSGGPLVNLAGEIVGVNEISYGLGGAIPSDLARDVAQALIKDGRVKRAWTGVELQARVGGDTRPGALVAWVAEKSPAAIAGLRAGDLLVKINGKTVDVTYAEQLPLVNQDLLGLSIGAPATLTVRRGTTDTPLTLTPTERPAAISTPTELRGWGLVVGDLTPFEARALARESTDGVRILSLRQGSPSDQARPALRPNDLILEVDGKPVRRVADLERETRAATATSRRAKILVGFDRERERFLTVVEVGELVADDPPREARKAWVPVSVQVLTPPLAERLSLKGKTGVRVTRVLDAETPLRVGDIILAIEGEPIRATAQNEEELFASAIRRHRVGATVTLTVVREGQEQPIAVVLAQTPTQPREMKRYEDTIFEFRVRDVAEEDRDDPTLAVTPGVLVESVAVRGWAALGRLNGGDLILALDGRTVKDIDDFEARMTDIHARKPAVVVFEIRRGIRTMFVELRPGVALNVAPGDILMKHRPLFAAAAITLILGGASPLYAQSPEERAAARDTVKKRGDAVVTVLATVKLRVNVGGRDQPSEIATQTNATVLDSAGLTVLSLSTLQPDEAYQRQLSRSVPPGTRTDVTSEATDIRIRTADGRELPARLVLRDQDLDLAFVRPTDPPSAPIPFVDAASARPSLLDPVLVLQRTNESMGWVISASLGSLQVVLDKPRTYYLVSFASMGGSGLGSPIFDMTGRFLGVILLRDTGMRGSTASGLLPADEIRDVARQAK